MKSYKWLFIFFFIISCKAQESNPIPTSTFKILEIKEDCNCPPPQVIVDTTSIGVIREKEREIHLLRVEIDDLKLKLENIRNLQILDSILKAKTE